jgi:hypothetical protein
MAGYTVVSAFSPRTRVISLHQDRCPRSFRESSRRSIDPVRPETGPRSDMGACDALRDAAPSLSPGQVRPRARLLRSVTIPRSGKIGRILRDSWRPIARGGVRTRARALLAIERHGVRETRKTSGRGPTGVNRAMLETSPTDKTADGHRPSEDRSRPRRVEPLRSRRPQYPRGRPSGRSGRPGGTAAETPVGRARSRGFRAG